MLDSGITDSTCDEQVHKSPKVASHLVGGEPSPADAQACKAGSLGGSSTGQDGTSTSAEAAEALLVAELRHNWDELLAEAASTCNPDRQGALLPLVIAPPPPLHAPCWQTASRSFLA